MGMYKVEILPEAEQHLEFHKKSGNRVVKEKIAIILKELKLHPEVGVGKPEKMKHEFSGFWSRRINLQNRITYEIDDVGFIVYVHYAKGHYYDK
jgi:toxin YoeB